MICTGMALAGWTLSQRGVLDLNHKIRSRLDCPLLAPRLEKSPAHDELSKSAAGTVAVSAMGCLRQLKHVPICYSTKQLGTIIALQAMVIFTTSARLGPPPTSASASAPASAAPMCPTTTGLLPYSRGIEPRPFFATSRAQCPSSLTVSSPSSKSSTASSSTSGASDRRLVGLHISMLPRLHSLGFLVLALLLLFSRANAFQTHFQMQHLLSKRS